MDELSKIMNDVNVLGEPIEEIEEEKPQEEPVETEKTNEYDTLYSELQKDVAGVDTLVSDLFDQKKEIASRESSLNDERERFEEEKRDFEKYCEEQRRNFEEDRKRFEEEMRENRDKLQKAEREYAKEVETIRTQLSLTEHGIELAEENLEEEKAQFEKYRDTEESRLNIL